MRVAAVKARAIRIVVLVVPHDAGFCRVRRTSSLGWPRCSKSVLVLGRKMLRLIVDPLEVADGCGGGVVLVAPVDSAEMTGGR